MIDPSIHDALRALEPDEVAAVARLVRRLRVEGWIGPAAADRWLAALERALQRRPLRHAQG